MPEIAREKTRGRLLRRLGIELYPGEGQTVSLLFLGFFLVISFQYVTKTVRQSTFIDSLGANNLPWVYLLVALFSYPLLQVWVRLADRVARHRLISVTCGTVALSLVLFWWLYGHPWGWVPVVFYVWATIAFSATVSQFWSFAHHVFDVRQARRLFGLLGAGGLLGGIVGGQIARLTSVLGETRHALLVAAVLLASVVVLIEWVQGHGDAVDEQHDEEGTAEDAQSARAGFELLRGSRHLRLVALTLVLGVIVAQFIDLQFNWAVEQATSGLGQRTAFYGNLFSGISIAAFVFQLLFTSRIHRTLGVGFAMRVLPVVLGLGTVALLVVGGMLPELVLAAAMALKVGESGVRYSLDQSTRELLFLPVPSAVRVKAKAFIDIFLQRGAKGLAALLLLPVTFGLVHALQVGWLTLVLLVAWLAAVAAAYRTYVGSFRTGLKERSVDVTVPINLEDVKTVELLVQSLGSTDPRQVLHSLELLDANGKGQLVPPLLLYHDDAEVRRRTLGVLSSSERRDATELIERRLHDDSPEVRAEAIRVLTEFNAGDACELMLPRLREPDPRVRAAAVTCLINYGDEQRRGLAHRALREMLADARREQRVEAVKAMGAVHGSEFEGQLIEALYDRDAAVAREAVLAVRRLVAREGVNPLFVPRLISLLENRRLKQDAREALVACGEEIIPILVHFMNDHDESILVRRALPKTLALIDTSATVPALIRTLVSAEDALLRAQVVEALATRRSDSLLDDVRPKIERAVLLEARRYLERLADLAALGQGETLKYEAPLVRWDTRELDLLTQMVAERVEEHLKTIFGLLALLYPPRDVWAAHRSLVSGRRALRTHALEYLDNTLTGEVRRNLFAVIDDVPLEDKLRLAERSFGVRRPTRIGATERFLNAGGSDEADGPSLTVAALYSVYTERMTELYPHVRRLADESCNSLVLETAEWVAGRLHLDETNATPGE